VNRMSVNESTLSRVWQHNENDQTVFAILTAFRGQYSREENLKRNAILAADVRKLGYGFFYLDGYWIENQGSAEERHVSEDSLFVIGKASDKNFANNLHNLGNKFDQEAIVLKDQDGVKLVFNNGSVQSIGTVRPGEMGLIYSKIRRRKDRPPATFVFREERDDLGWVGRLAVQIKINQEEG
jgi:hypothetical protein